MQYTGTTTQQFNQFFESNYNHFYRYCTNYSIPEDTLHDTYFNILDRVNTIGFEDKGMITYVLRSLKNKHLNDKNTLYNRKTVNITDGSVNDIGDVLLTKEKEQQKEQEYEEIARETTRDLFWYLNNELKCSELELTLFKVYYLSKEKQTYETLSKNLEINKNKITNILREIKKKLKKDFFEWQKQNNLTKNLEL